MKTKRNGCAFLTVLFFLILQNASLASPDLSKQNFGRLLTAASGISIWWAEGTWKIFKEQSVPEKKSRFVAISAARNEYEPFQLVLRSKKDLKNVVIEASDLKNGKSTIEKNNIEISRVEYVQIQKPSDLLGHPGLYPDPLPLYKAPVQIKANENQPFWFTVYVPKDAAPGIYKGNIFIKHESSQPVVVELKLKVFNFTLSDETHTKTAYGVYLNKEYHGLTEREDMIKTYDLYLQMFKAHRLSPYSPMQYFPVKQNINCENKTVELDFSEFDRGAERYLEEFQFNGFNYGWGLPEELCGNKRFTEEYNELFKKMNGIITQHLKENGWLQKAYVYWIDEPPREKWDEVKQGMELLKECCPGLRRLLTINTAAAPTPTFYGYVDVWVPIFHLYNPKSARFRQKRGEKVWWYVCTEPKSPWPNNFIDHPAINHRIRFWMMQKYRVDGDLYWSTTYWAQNPWEVSMSYSPEGYGWGNGDGRLLYPPAKEKSPEPLIAPPVTSIRFEMIREGLEDKEYFWILEQEILRLKAKNDQERAQKGEQALFLIDTLVRDLTSFEKDPQKLYEAREKIAAAVEEVITGR